jgi:signal-transduction protein with cAMP-binding, CBS, and nucleotidyltransferase domain
MKLQDMMVRPVIQASPEESVSDVATRMQEHAVGCLVVTSGDAVKGIVTDRDLLACLAHCHDPRRCKVSLHMHRPVIVLPPEEDHTTAIRVLRERNIKRLPVACGGKLLGIITLSDLAALAIDEAIKFSSSLDFFTDVLKVQSARRGHCRQPGEIELPTAPKIQTNVREAGAMDAATVS